MSPRLQEYHLRAFHCPGVAGFAYKGWWLYAYPVIEGVAVRDRRAVWIKEDWRLDAVRQLLADSYGITLFPAEEATLFRQVGYANRFAEAFHQHAPQGVRAWGENGHPRRWVSPRGMRIRTVPTVINEDPALRCPRCKTPYVPPAHLQDARRADGDGHTWYQTGRGLVHRCWGEGVRLEVNPWACEYYPEETP